MKEKVLHIIFLFLAFAGEVVLAQTESFKGYKIEGDEIVFIFDKRDYSIAMADKQNRRYHFEYLEIENVVVAGSFNDWSKYDWKMSKIDENRYELRKNLDDFDDEFSWEFKFVVNNALWAEPSKEYANVVRAFRNGHALPAYNLKIYAAYPDDSGNVTFTLGGHEDARKVILSGSFNKWNEHLFKMKRTEDCWSITLKIRPGEYQYKFIIDGEWIEDPVNPDKRRNEFHGYNSVVHVKAPASFILNGYADAEKVILAGSFNDWSESAYEMTRTQKGWVYRTMLSGGKHHYKFIVDDTWILDPDNPVKEYDDQGNINSVCMVK
ncbi:hypothetical protein [Aquimarina spongiae]|uniref:Glycogen recognition site of AMP-activated protein kinase n=1 Tax=Aquimarina spongiae TaxID=570521 RepID=A0A1M6I893_9FLAO|nr:hypothetical protein [Aquimarina spongiae]SHJ30665.1 Glycogen recognition site of AMP-activated protein kinase [Aquimarina spongiae]